MQKTSMLLLIMGGMLVLGIMLTYYGNYILFEDLDKKEGEVMIGSDMTIQTELEKVSTNGIYALNVINYDGEDVTVHILNPHDVEVELATVNEEFIEGTFAIDRDGIYKMIVKSNETDPVGVFGVIGPEPSAGAKSVGFVSLYVLVIGVFGMIGVGIFAIKSKKRPS